MAITLHSSPFSPFGRKVKLALLHLGLMDKVTVVGTDTMNPEDPIRRPTRSARSRRWCRRTVPSSMTAASSSRRSTSWPAAAASSPPTRRRESPR